MQQKKTLSLYSLRQRRRDALTNLATTIDKEDDDKTYLPIPRQPELHGERTTSAYLWWGACSHGQTILRDSEIEMHAELFTPVLCFCPGRGKTKRTRGLAQQRRRRTTNINVIGHVRLISLSLLHCTSNANVSSTYRLAVSSSSWVQPYLFSYATVPWIPSQAISSPTSTDSSSAMHEGSTEALYSWVGHDPIRFTGINSSSHNVPVTTNSYKY